MNIPIDRVVVRIVAFCACVWFPVASQATLGEKVETVGRDRKALSAAKRATTENDRYTVYEMASEANVVREYVNRSGVVFGVAWKGLVPPDLSVLLGCYHQDYRDAKKKQPRTRGERHSRVTGKSVVVETWGHMKSLRGRAYDPALMPEGVTAHEIE